MSTTFIQRFYIPTYLPTSLLDSTGGDMVRVRDKQGHRRGWGGQEQIAQIDQSVCERETIVLYSTYITKINKDSFLLFVYFHHVFIWKRLLWEYFLHVVKEIQ